MISRTAMLGWPGFRPWQVWQEAAGCKIIRRYEWSDDVGKRQAGPWRERCGRGWDAAAAAETGLVAWASHCPTAAASRWQPSAYPGSSSAGLHPLGPVVHGLT